MHDALTPHTFLRYNRPLRGVMIDNQPWFDAQDFCRLIGHRHPQRISRLMEDDQIRTVRFLHASGGEEDVQVINESGIYRALGRFPHPENRSLRRWLNVEVIPALRDAFSADTQQPRRTQMTWASQRVSMLEWQGKLWVPLDSLPWFGTRPMEEAGGGLLKRWLR